MAPRDVYPKALEPVNMLPYMARGLCRRDQVTDPEMGTVLDYQHGPVSPQGPHEREAGGSEAM